MKKIYSILNFHRFSTTKLDSFANNVLNGIYKNQNVFENPVVDQGTFQKAITIYTEAAADYQTFGITKKTAFATARKNLIDILDQLADYTDKVATGDTSKIVLAGFDSSADIRKSNVTLDKIKNFDLKRTDTEGEIIVVIPPILNHGVVNYFAICSENESRFSFENDQLKITDQTLKLDFTKKRKKSFKGLTPGTIYYFYVFASNTVSVSPISDAKSIMAV